MDEVSLINLWLPIVLTTVALFFASFLSWTVSPLHKPDWVKLDREDDFLQAARGLELRSGSYMFPGQSSPEEMKSEEFQQKLKEGPVGVMTVFTEINMGRNLGLTLLYFLGCSFCLGYLGTVALAADAGFLKVFRFIATAGVMTFLAAILQHAIWFHNRVIGHVIESICYSLIAGVIFAAMWPAAL